MVMPRFRKRFPRAVTLPVGDKSVGTVAESIDGRRAEQFVLEGLSPFLKVQIAGDDRHKHA